MAIRPQPALPLGDRPSHRPDGRTQSTVALNSPRGIDDARAAAAALPSSITTKASSRDDDAAAIQVLARQLDLTLVWSTTGTVRFAGPEGACIAMLGMEPTAIVAGTISRLTHPDDRLDFEEALNRVLRLQRSHDLTLEDQTICGAAADRFGAAALLRGPGQAWYLRDDPYYAEFVYVFRPVTGATRGDLGGCAEQASSSGNSTGEGFTESSSSGAATVDPETQARVLTRDGQKRGSQGPLAHWTG
ncbi:hypothetical protein FNF28_05775 [Cafeteria roenbergensis]|uniref:PAS domain-containing protein n=1 Tax=Cafeteria roenbergensis TaxID=33653 RepID=A0A5A8D3B0_CAFRO|nr:hypothetical protein FNF28_05775 [Cafeteria roenbergensis]